MSTLSFKPEKRYLYIARRWLWLLILAPILAAAVGYFFSKDQAPAYEAESQLLIGPGMDTPYQDINALRASEHVMQTYKKMAYTDTFLQAVITDLNLDEMSPGELRSYMDVLPDPASLLLTINVQTAKPDLSVDLANAAAKEMVRMSPTNEGSSAATLREDNQVQAAKLADSIKQTEARVAALDATLAQLNAEGASGTAAQTGASDAQLAVNQQESQFVALATVSEQTQVGIQVMQAFIANTLERIQQLETRLASTDPNLQPIVIEQITNERGHLSDLQKTLVELQTRVEDQALDAYILALNVNIKAVQDKINATVSYDIANRRLLFDRLDQERGRLTDAEKIASSRRQMVLDRISDERNRLSDIQGMPAQERLFVSDQITSERNHLDNLQQSYAALNDAIFKASTNQAQVAQLANQATPVPSNLRLIVLMAAIAGMAAAAAFVLIYGYFDTTIYTPGDLEAMMGFPTLGRLHKSRAGLKQNGRAQPAESLVAHSRPFSPLAEDYRNIVARLAYELPTASDTAGQAILVTGLSDKDITSEVAANLAITLAQTGEVVLLVDSNLYRPVIADLFEMSAEKGFTTSIADPRQPVDARPIPWLNSLSVLPSGPAPQHPFSLLASEHTTQVINRLKERAAYVLIAGAPITQADMLVLARQVDGLILVVAEQHTDRSKVEEIVKTAQVNHWNVIGTVLLSKNGAKSGAVKEPRAQLQPGPVPHNNGKAAASEREIAQLASSKR